MGEFCKYDGRVLGHAAWILVQVLFWVACDGARVLVQVKLG